MFIVLKKIRRLGMTLADSLCGLFLISLGLGFYLQTSQMINHQLSTSHQHLVEIRREYEHLKNNENK